MISKLVLTVIAEDRVGIVEELSRLVREAQGNWLDANLARLAGKFAGIIEIELPASNSGALQARLGSLSDMQVICHAGSSHYSHHGARLNLRVTGNDRPGIVSDITHVLRRVGANIRKLASHCDSAPNWGSPLFVLELEVELAPAMTPAELVALLEAVADDLMVDELAASSS